MKVQIDAKRLLELENRSNLLMHLENGGIDNWEWYGESTKNYEKYTELVGYGESFQLKWSNNEDVYYNNNLCRFIGYIDKDFAVVVTEIEPNYDIDTSANCAGCLIGDSDNKISCNCEEISDILNAIEDNTPATHIPLVVKTSMLYDKPISIQKHEQELQKLIDEKAIILDSTKELTKIKNSLQSKIDEMNKNIEELKKLEEV